MVLARIGRTVQGLLTREPASMATTFSRNAQAKRNTLMVCRPYTGEKAIKTPIANASAVRRGESPRCRICCAVLLIRDQVMADSHSHGRDAHSCEFEGVRSCRLER